jgi:cytochrome c biogenesis protein CcmG/thiol:disulfide interchange protein DsbE
MKRILLAAPLMTIGLLLGVMAYALFNDQAGSDPQLGKPVPALPLTDFPGGEGDFDPDTVEGPYLLNFWASWCPPCVVEHPLLQELHDQGVPIMGVVYKDTPEAANRFLDRLGDPFAALAEDEDGRAAFEIGVTGPPETFLVDADGVVRARWRGAVTDQVWVRVFDEEWQAAGGTPVDVSALPSLGAPAEPS